MRSHYKSLKISQAGMLVFILVLSAISAPTEGKRKLTSTCQTKKDGSHCHHSSKPWQHDGTCYYNKKRQECAAPDTQYFELKVVVHYRSLSAKARGKPVKDMYIRGYGPGISWDKSIKMMKSAKAVDIWTAKISYKSDSDGLTCLRLTYCTLNQNALEFRINTNDLGTESMKGPNFYIPLPVSKSQKGSVSFFTPQVNVYPWFNQNFITTKSFKFNMSPHLLRYTMEVKCDLLYPPSFNENIRKHYPLIIILGRSKYYTHLLEYLFVHEASVEEAVILMVDPPSDYKNITMLPFSSTRDLQCKGSSTCDDCQSCWVKKRSEPCDREEFILKAKKCLLNKYLGGIGEAFMESVLNELIVKVQEMTTNRLKYDPPNKRITLISSEEMGVLVFHTAITRPDIVENVACFSPKFFLPLYKSYSTGSKILEVIDKQAIQLETNTALQALHSTQKYYIDSGEDDDFFFPIASGLKITENVIMKLKSKLKLEENTNIMYQVIAKQRLRYMNVPSPNYFSRMKTPLLFFHKAKGGPNKDYPRSLKLSEEFFAETRGSDGSEDEMNIKSNSNNSYDEFTDENDEENIEDNGVCLNQCTAKEVPLSVFIGSISEWFVIYDTSSIYVTCVLVVYKKLHYLSSQVQCNFYSVLSLESH